MDSVSERTQLDSLNLVVNPKGSGAYNLFEHDNQKREQRH